MSYNKNAIKELTSASDCCWYVILFCL